MKRRIKILDVSGDNYTETPKPLPESFGKELTTIKRAREWLTNPANWIDSKLFVIKWIGLIPYVSREHGRQLLDEPWNDDLPRVVCIEQMRLKSGGASEQEVIGGETS